MSRDFVGERSGEQNLYGFVKNMVAGAVDMLGMFTIEDGGWKNIDTGGGGYCGEFLGLRDMIVKKEASDTAASRGWLILYITWTEDVFSCCPTNSIRVGYPPRYRFEAAAVTFEGAESYKHTDMISGLTRLNTHDSASAVKLYYLNRDDLDWLPSNDPDGWRDGSIGGRRNDFGGPSDLPADLGTSAVATLNLGLNASWNCCEGSQKTVGPSATP